MQEPQPPDLSNRGEWQPSEEVIQRAQHICQLHVARLDALRRYKAESRATGAYQSGPNYEQLEQLRGQVEQKERALGELLAPDPPPFIVERIGPYPPESDEWFLIDAYTISYDSGELQKLALQPYWQLAAGAAVALHIGAEIDIAYAKSADRAVNNYFSGVRWMVDGLHGFLADRGLAPTDARDENNYGLGRNVTPEATQEL